MSVSALTDTISASAQVLKNTQQAASSSLSRITSVVSNWQQSFYSVGHLAASYLTDPACYTRQWYWSIPLTNKLYPEAKKTELYARQVLFGIGVVVASIATVVTAPFGILVRALFIWLQEKPFLYYRSQAAEKSCSAETITLFSKNVCGITAGYSYTDGGVLPWKARLKSLVEEIQQQNADVVCLSEVFDIQTARALISGLKGTYAHFYYCIGPKVLGPGSGLFMACKYNAQTPSFCLFPDKIKDGRSKNCNKGFFSVTLPEALKDHQPMKVMLTHLGHSELPAHATQGEVSARKKQAEMILEHMQLSAESHQILTGDLNLDETEFQSQNWPQYFDRGVITNAGMTWGGDTFCKTLTGEPVENVSEALTLDYTLCYKANASNTANLQLQTTHISSLFDGEEFNLDATSDHDGVFTKISLKI